MAGLPGHLGAEFGSGSWGKLVGSSIHVSQMALLLPDAWNSGGAFLLTRTKSSQANRDGSFTARLAAPRGRVTTCAGAGPLVSWAGARAKPQVVTNARGSRPAGTVSPRSARRTTVHLKPLVIRSLH